MDIKEVKDWVEKHAEGYIDKDMIDIILEALKEKQERGNVEQWLDDMDNIFEPIKIQSALQSEILKLNYRKEHNPKAISVLDYTIIAVLMKALENK